VCELITDFMCDIRSEILCSQFVQCSVDICWLQHLLVECCACRNNLTIIDVVTMQGQGGYGELRFSNRKPGSLKPLTFEMSDKQLKQCDSTFCRLFAVKQHIML